MSLDMRSIVAAAWLAVGALGRSTPQETARSAASERATGSPAVSSQADAQRGDQSPPAPSGSTASSPSDDPVLAELGDMLEEARGAKQAKDFAGARARIAEAIEEALAEL